MNARARRPAVALLALGIALAGCTSSTPTATTPVTTPRPEQKEPAPPPVIAPLTGLPVRSRAVARRPALAVKIDNAPAARPHVGLDRADIVYEEPVEGGVTRFIAIFHSKDAPTIGPVRSARLADIDVLAEYGRPILAFSGAAGYVLAELARANLALVPHGSHGSIYWRGSGRRAPHNLFSRTSALRDAGIAKRATRAPKLFRFAETEGPARPGWTTGVRTIKVEAKAPSEQPAGRSVRIPFSSSSFTSVWTYHSGSGLYRRSHGTAPHRTADGKRITASNVIIQRVAVQIGGRGGRAGASTPNPQLVGSGEAVLLRDGIRINGRWSRPSLSRPTTFTDADGREFRLAPGTTWIELVPTHIRPTYGG